MEPASFPEANTTFGPPEGMDETHCRRIPAALLQMKGGPFDGSDVVIVAWKPSKEDLERLSAGGLVYMSCFGGLPPHYLSTQISKMIE